MHMIMCKWNTDGSRRGQKKRRKNTSGGKSRTTDLHVYTDRSVLAIGARAAQRQKDREGNGPIHTPSSARPARGDPGRPQNPTANGKTSTADME